jgi:hypothetical protein
VTTKLQAANSKVDQLQHTEQQLAGQVSGLKSELDAAAVKLRSAELESQEQQLVAKQLALTEQELSLLEEQLQLTEEQLHVKNLELANVLHQQQHWQLGDDTPDGLIPDPWRKSSSTSSSNMGASSRRVGGAKVYRGYQAFPAPAISDSKQASSSSACTTAAPAAATAAAPAPVGPKVVVKTQRQQAGASSMQGTGQASRSPRVAVAAGPATDYSRDALVGVCLLSSVLALLSAQQAGQWQQVGMWWW